jgi:hypothetical protein
MLLAFTSGFAIMSVELLGGRILAPFFGNSIYVWGSIITVFLLSLSVGYLCGGRLSLHQPNLKRYGLFFIAAAAAMVPIMLVGNAVLERIFIAVEDPRYGSLLASTALFFLPTAILGMIAPYSVRLLVDDARQSGLIAGMLYFISTVGSGIGTLSTSFYLVLVFEVNQILIALCASLVICGLAAMLFPKRLSLEPS